MPPLSPITHDESQLFVTRKSYFVKSQYHRKCNLSFSPKRWLAWLARVVSHSSRRLCAVYRVVFVLTFAWKRSGAETAAYESAKSNPLFVTLLYWWCWYVTGVWHHLIAQQLQWFVNEVDWDSLTAVIYLELYHHTNTNSLNERSVLWKHYFHLNSVANDSQVA